MTTIGERIAEYRKAAGLTAEQLAERVGLGLTRSVIANVESGRKSDLPSAQVVGIAWALSISPILLLVDLGAPDDPAPEDFGGLTNFEAALWMLGEVLYAPEGTEFMNGIPQLDRAASLAGLRITAVKNIYRWRQREAHLTRQLARQTEDAAKELFRKEIDDVLGMIRDAEERLRAAGSSTNG